MRCCAGLSGLPFPVERSVTGVGIEIVGREERSVRNHCCCPAGQYREEERSFRYDRRLIGRGS